MPPAPCELWRISDYVSLLGEGGLSYSGRWNTAGRSICYLAESAAGALIEVLVHLEVEESDLPLSYNLFRVSVASGIETERLVHDNEVWKQNLAITRVIGDEWLRSNRSVLAEAPSAIMPSTKNYLLNPAHPDAAGIQIVEAVSAQFDPRLLKRIHL